MTKKTTITAADRTATTDMQATVVQQPARRGRPLDPEWDAQQQQQAAADAPWVWDTWGNQWVLPKG